MGLPLVPELDALLKGQRVAWVWDDFQSYTDGQMWTKGGASNAIAASDHNNGWLSIITGGSQNNEAWVASTRKNWQFRLGAPMEFVCRINFAEANVNTAAIYAGFSSAFATGLISTSTAAALASSFSGAGFYLFTGSTTWGCATSIGTTQQTQLSNVAASPNTNDQTLRVVVKPNQALGVAEVTFAIDGNPVLDPSQKKPTELKQIITYSGAARMGIGVYVQTNSGNAETLNLDFIYCGMLRTLAGS